LARLIFKTLIISRKQLVIVIQEEALSCAWVVDFLHSTWKVYFSTIAKAIQMLHRLSERR
jgi:hypothetical protein